MKRKKVKVILGSLFGTFLLFFIILVAHIATAKPVENAHIQVSRIDFEQPLDSALSTTVTQQLRAIPGVKSDVIVKNNVVVYFHDNTVANSQHRIVYRYRCGIGIPKSAYCSTIVVFV
jgi:threonyl-tRNA synthetase